MAFRRVAYHRSWFLIVVGTLGLAPPVALLAEPLVYGNSPDGLNSEHVGLLIIGVMFALLVIARGVTGSWSKRQLRVDVAAGKLKLPDGSLHDLDNLGPLTIDKKVIKHLNPRTIRVTLHDYLLRADNVDYYLFVSNYESETKIRYDAVEAAVLQYRLRRILERPDAEGVFRAGPDPRAEILSLAGSPENARAALGVLTRDSDRSVRDQAAKLLGSLSS